jgi:ADP-heptose:LPS heptosyltransferase
VGYARDVRSVFLTDKLHAPLAGGTYAAQPTLDAYLQIAYALGCPKESPRMELATTPADEQMADDAWRKLAIPDDKPVVLLNSGAAFGASKLWPTEYFAELARRIASNWGHTVLAICGPREREIARTITSLAAHPSVISLADARLGDDFPLPIGLSKACVRRAALMITTDSGPRHFAPAFNVPVITLFGPTHISLSETHFAKAVHLQHKVSCGPCMKQVCPLGHHECMRDLSVDVVYRAVDAQLSAIGAGTSDDRTSEDLWSNDDFGAISGPHMLPPPARYRGARAPTIMASRPAVANATSAPARPVSSRAIEPARMSTGQSQAGPSETPRPAPGTAQLWINDRCRATLAEAGLTDFTALMATTNGHLMRCLPDRENWRLQLHASHAMPAGAFLKKHHERSVTNWLRAKLTKSIPATPGRIEAENVARLAAAGIPAMGVIAFGEQLHASGLLESFVLTAELTGYAPLDDLLRSRFTPANNPAAAGRRRERDFDRLLAAVADVAGRLHRQGYNHRDLYCCHFFIRVLASGAFDVRLIDLQRVQHRTRFRRRWIVKDLAQLAYSAPREWVNCSRRLAFFKAYLGVTKLRAQDKRLARSVLRKQWLMELKLGTHP